MPQHPLLLPFIAVAAFALTSAPTGATPPPPSITYHHMWTDQAGVSHLATCSMRRFDLKSMSPPASPQWQDRQPQVNATVIPTVQPSGWSGAWHEDPKVQWIIPLRGRWFVQTMDGSRAEMGPGDIALGEDQNTRPVPRGPFAGKTGHLAGNIGSEPVSLMVIQLGEPSTTGQPCRFK